jgi:hypothetical protein
MLRTVAASGAIAALLLPATANAQSRPDLSGTWTAVQDSTGTGPTGKPLPPNYGAQFTIDQQGQTLTLTRTFTPGPATIKYTLDGSETTTRMPGRVCEPDTGAIWTAAWEGEAVALHMIGAVPANGKTVKMDVKSTLKLESPDTIRVDVAARVANQPAPRVTTTTYKRSAAAPAAAAPASVERAKGSMAQVSWISGTWVGGSGTTTIEERWTPSAGGSMIGVSRTIRDGNLSAFEFLCIVERDGGLLYQAMPNGRMPATDFTLTKIDADSAVFENPSHDFPRMIRYTRQPDGSLEAVVSGEAGQKPLTFVFKRQE